MKNLFIFLGGGLVGAGITYIGMSAKFKKYEAQINAELANIPTTSEPEEKKEEDTDEPLTDDDVIISEEEAERIQKEEYDKLAGKYNDAAIAEDPYVIDMGEAGEFDNYKTVDLTYYVDDVLAYDDGTVVDDVEQLITEAALEEFNEYGVVAVRNDFIKTDFIVSKHTASYAETYEE